MSQESLLVLARQDFFDPNVDGTMALAEAAQCNGVKQFVYVSSLAAKVSLLNNYAASKAAAEVALQNYTAKMCLTILRPAAVYGPGDTATLPLLKSLMARVAIIPGSATAQFSMVHVQDVALGVGGCSQQVSAMAPLKLMMEVVATRGRRFPTFPAPHLGAGDGNLLPAKP